MDFKPINYNLTFIPDLEKFKFWGREIFSFKVEKPISRIVLDAVDLKILNCELLSINKNTVKSFTVDKKEEKLIIYLLQELRPNKYKLHIEFEGALSDKLAGFYRSKYLVDGKERWLATTQFEAIDARRTFPCVDHPSYKATFEVSLIVDKHLTVISNTLQRKIANLEDQTNLLMTDAVAKKARQGDIGNKKMVIFEKTPLMSTYLLYLGIGEFEFIEDKYKDVLIRVGATPGKSQYGKFALDWAKKCLKYFEEYFSYPYPLKKLDLIAIPDFASGAMENWGAVTFRENALLFYPGKSSKTTKQRIVEVVAHELAHMWFGNLVTMKWWDDLWLNESFATYLAYKVVDYYFPKWRVWSDYLIDTVFSGMELDGLQSSHPIKVKVGNVDQINELFDEIAYDKGGSILRMLENYLGENRFREGLKTYIKTFKYRNAQAEDLWNCFEKVSDKPVVDLMKKYVIQPGFPEIKLQGGGNVLQISQNRFLFTRETSASKMIWYLPYNLNYSRSRDDIRLFAQEREMVKIGKTHDFILINPRYSGFFISNYSKKLQKNLENNMDRLDEKEKMGLIHDLYFLVLAEEKELDELYHCINTMIQVGETVVLGYIIQLLILINFLLGDKRSKELVVKFSQKALRLVGLLPKEEELPTDANLRTAAIMAFCQFNDERITDFVLKKFGGYLEDEGTLEADLRLAVYSASVAADDKNYFIVKDLYKKSPSQEERAKFLTALGRTKNRNFIKDSLDFCLEKEVSFAHSIYLISSVSNNYFSKGIVLDWLMENWAKLVKRSGGVADMILRRILQTIIPTHAIGREKEISGWLKKNKTDRLEKTVQQVVEKLAINSNFLQKYKKIS